MALPYEQELNAVRFWRDVDRAVNSVLVALAVPAARDYSVNGNEWAMTMRAHHYLVLAPQEIPDPACAYRPGWHGPMSSAVRAHLDLVEEIAGAVMRG